MAGVGRVLSKSCKWNRDIDWLIFTDQDPPENQATNVRYEKVAFADHKARIGAAIRLDLSAIPPLKLCDLKTTLGFVFASDSKGTGTTATATST